MSRSWLCRAAAAIALCAAAVASAEESPVPSAGTARGAAPELTPERFERLRDEILPSPEERAWREIGWHPTFWGAIVVAHAEKKPVLLWAMNGHPLGCT